MMKSTVQISLLLGAIGVSALPTKEAKRDVDTRFPYTGPAIPVGDWVDQTVNGNGKGFPRLVEPPAVAPASKNPTNNVNVIQLSYVPNGVNIHFQTPFGLGGAPSINWGTKKAKLTQTATGQTETYDRTPPCSLVSAVTQCSQFFHNIQIAGLQADTTYYYQIPAANGTTASKVLEFTTAAAAGAKGAFTIAVLNDMGYTNAHGTHKLLTEAADDLAFAWHGGDISYADDWYSGILPCESDWPVCYNGTSTQLPGNGSIPKEYDAPLPAGEVPNQGGPQGGDMGVLYESNWDLWQNWMSSVTAKIPYMVLPGNHEASCAEFDGPNNTLTSYLNSGEINTPAPKTALTYYSCPPSQRNFTAFTNRFRMPGNESGGVGNFWYSFDYGLGHFIAINSETDFAYSPEYPFLREAKPGETLPTESETYITDAGPFGAIENNDWKNNAGYEQLQWLEADLKSVDRTKTPWVIAMGHRPMYSSEKSGYLSNVRAAFEPLFLKYKVDVYMAGHVHWYERMVPLGANGTIVAAAQKNANTYVTGTGETITHLINGAAGNIESHSVLGSAPQLNITAVLNQQDYGFAKFTFHDAKKATWQWVKGDGTGVGDKLNLVKGT